MESRVPVVGKGARPSLKTTADSADLERRRAEQVRVRYAVPEVVAFYEELAIERKVQLVPCQQEGRVQVVWRRSAAVAYTPRRRSDRERVTVASVVRKRGDE